MWGILFGDIAGHRRDANEGAAVTPTLTNRAVLAATMVVGVIGAVDAAAGRDWDLFAVFVMVVVLQATLLLRLTAHRVEIRLRSDLARWLRDRAADEGDSIDLIADRAVGAYRADLLGDRTSA